MGIPQSFLETPGTEPASPCRELGRVSSCSFNTATDLILFAALGGVFFPTEEQNIKFSDAYVPQFLLIGKIMELCYGLRPGNDSIFSNLSPNDCIPQSINLGCF